MLDLFLMKAKNAIHKFSQMNVCALMVYFDRFDVSEGIDVKNKFIKRVYYLSLSLFFR